MGVMRFVYLATNERMLGLVKIGSTSNVAKRMESLSSPTGVAGKYVCLCHCQAGDANAVEQKLHKMFESYRVEGSREIYEMDWRIIAVAMVALAANSTHDESETLKPEKHKPKKRKLRKSTSGKSKSHPSKGNVLSESERQKKYMQYVAQNTMASDVQKRAKACDTYLRYLARMLSGRTVYGITDVKKAEELRNQLRKGGEFYKIDKQVWAGGMLSAMNYYVRFLWSLMPNSFQPTSIPRHGQVKLSPDGEQRQKGFTKYIPNGNTARGHKGALHLLARKNLIDEDVFEITNIIKLRMILRCLEGGVYDIKEHSKGKGIILALKKYIEFLQQGGGR